MGLEFLVTLPGPGILKCKLCAAHLAWAYCIVDEEEVWVYEFFDHIRGVYYVLGRLLNACFGVEEISKCFEVMDIYCCRCQQLLGYRYYIFQAAWNNFHWLAREWIGCSVIQGCIKTAHKTVLLSTQKTGSYAIEKCLKSSAGDHIIEALLNCKRAELAEIALDQFGNYVLQTALQATKLSDASSPHRNHPIASIVWKHIPKGSKKYRAWFLQL